MEGTTSLSFGVPYWKGLFHISTQGLFKSSNLTEQNRVTGKNKTELNGTIGKYEKEGN